MRQALRITRTAIVLVNWNGLEDTRRCLRSLQVLEGEDWSAIVVDNGSQNSEHSRLAAEFPAVVVLPQKSNLGFAGGCNVGIRYAMEHGFSHVFLLNNDTLIDDARLVSKLVDSLEVPAVACVGPKVTWSGTGRVWFAGARLRLHLGTIKHLGWKQPAQRLQGERATDYVTGCALMAKTSTFREHGLFDDSYFLYFEETDWCERLRRAGERCVVQLDTSVQHHVSASTRHLKEVQGYYLARSRFLFFRRWAGNAFWGLPLAAGICWVARTCIPLFVSGKPAAGRAVIRGAWHGLLGKRGPVASV